MKERWKSVPDFPGYEVSDRGRVRSFWKNVGRSPRVLGSKPLVLRPGNAGRYLNVTLYRKNGRRVSQSIHVLVLLAFKGPARGREARHWNGKSFQNRLSNLRWSSHLKNIRDKHRHGTMPRGSKHGQSILKEAQVRFIRRSRFSQIALAKKFGVSKSTVNAIVHRRLWRHLKR